MKTTKAPAPAPRSFPRWWVPVFLAGILVVLFWKSFLPDYVAFANDGPLGQQHASWGKMPGAMSAIWGDLNDIGSPGGAFTPSISTLLHWVLGPLGYSRFYTPVSLFILGISIWFFFRQMRFSNLAAALGGTAGMLVTTSFSDACWGVASHEIAIGMDFCALGLFAGNAYEPSAARRWLRLALAGLCVGINVIEAADIGAILSVFVALFVFFQSLVEDNGTLVVRAARGAVRTMVIALFAGFIAFQSVSNLVTTSITGIVGTQQDAETKMRQWDFATQWSLPKKETLGLIVPGLFGYRMDTPKDMAQMLQDPYQGGVYWGGIGRTPAIDRWLDSGGKGPQPPGLWRFSGTGEYEGVLVVLIAIWAIAQSLRGKNSVFTPAQRKFILLGAVLLVLSLLMSWGRFAPAFYGAFYQLKYASTIRNPAKFLIVFTFVLVMLFGYGLQGLWKLYLQPAGQPGRLGAWWARVRGFDRGWAIGSLGTVLLSFVALVIYASQKTKLIEYLGVVGYDERASFPTFRPSVIAAFSMGQAIWFVVTFAVAVGLLTLIVAGNFSGKRARMGSLLLGALLVFDMGRANLPWIIHWDYKQKYEVGTLNPIVDFLTQHPYEHRVAKLPFNTPPGYEAFEQLYDIEWMQHLFPYYDIQSLDKVQMPRMPVDLEAYERMLTPHSMDDVAVFTRYWQLTNTRYLLGPAGFLEVLNGQLDPAQHRYRIAQRFNVVLKPGVEQYHQRLEELTAVPNDNGDYALFDFTGALPRARLYARWETNSTTDISRFSTNGLSDNEQYVLSGVGTNGFLTLKKLAAPAFDPQQAVLLDAPLATPSGAATDAGTVDFESYSTKDIRFHANVTAPAVLLDNDHFDPNWQAFIDGKPAPLFHANFIMRGLFIEPGQHEVELRFVLPPGPIYITLAGFAIALALVGWLLISKRPSSSSPERSK